MGLACPSDKCLRHVRRVCELRTLADTRLLLVLQAVVVVVTAQQKKKDSLRCVCERLSALGQCMFAVHQLQTSSQNRSSCMLCVPGFCMALQF